MYDRRFFRTKLGQAALASIAAMVTFIGISGQIAVSAPSVPMAMYQQVEIA